MLSSMCRASRRSSRHMQRGFASSASNEPLVWLNGTYVGSDCPVSALDPAFVRGIGAFEVVRVVDGAGVGLEQHLDRLARSAAHLGLELPGSEQSTSDVVVKMREAVLQAIDGDGSDAGVQKDGMVRLMVTRRGGVGQGASSPPQWITVRTGLPSEPTAGIDVHALAAPWHPGGFATGMSGIKWLSYAPNMLSLQAAQELGSDDALLFTREGKLLEGTTFAVAWLTEEENSWLTPPAPKLGLLPSVTLGIAAEAARNIGSDIRDAEATLGILDLVAPGNDSPSAAPSCLIAMSSGRDCKPLHSISFLLSAQGRADFTHLNSGSNDPADRDRFRPKEFQRLAQRDEAIALGATDEGAELYDMLLRDGVDSIAATRPNGATVSASVFHEDAAGPVFKVALDFPHAASKPALKSLQESFQAHMRSPQAATRA